MNIYNSYLPFNNNFQMNQLPIYQNPLSLLHLDSLIATHYQNLAQLSAAASLNQKRQLLSQPLVDLDGIGPMIGTAQKKFRTEQGAYNLPLNEVKNFGQKINTKAPIISLVDDEDCFIVDNSGTEQANFNDFYMPPNDFSKFQAYKEQLATLKQTQLSNMKLESQRKFDDFEADLKFVKPSEIIVIDNEDETDQQQSTCQATPVIETEIQTPAKVDIIPNIEVVVASESKIINDEIKTQENNFVKNCCAKLPLFQLSVLTSQQKKGRTVKSVWTPAAFEPEAFQSWLKQIEETVGIQITSEAKVLQTMKSFNMNIQVALAEIKRNKAYYRSYFRIQKLQKN